MIERVQYISSLKDQKLQHELHAALDAGRLFLQYQPITDARSRAVTAAEALIRWNHEQGIRQPDEFIPAVEYSAAILPVGFFTLSTAIRQQALWQAYGHHIRVSVNVAPFELAYETFADTVLALLHSCGVAPNTLELEITERIAFGDLPAVVCTVRKLRAHGVQISLDDFGTGNNTISLLRHLEVDSLKFDRSFIAGITDSPRDVTIVLALLAAARSLGVRVVAEGAETPAHIEVLAQLGCDEIQGFAIGRPQNSTAFRSLFLEAPALLKPGH